MPAESVGEVIYRRVNMNYVAMSEKESWDHLVAQQTLFVSFVQEDGYPHVSPVRFVVIDRKVYFSGKSYKVKMRLARDAKVCCAWDNAALKFEDLKGAVIWGRSRTVDDPALADRATELLKAKYEGRSASSSIGIPLGWVRKRATEKKTVVEIRPERVSTWDNTKLVDEAGT